MKPFICSINHYCWYTKYISILFLDDEIFIRRNIFIYEVILPITTTAHNSWVLKMKRRKCYWLKVEHKSTNIVFKSTAKVKQYLHIMLLLVNNSWFCCSYILCYLYAYYKSKLTAIEKLKKHQHFTNGNSDRNSHSYTRT